MQKVCYRTKQTHYI